MESLAAYFAFFAVVHSILADPRFKTWAGKRFGNVFDRWQRLAYTVLAASLAGLIPGSVCAFPPAPHHLVYGLVSDEMGETISLNTAQVILESSTGVQIRGLIVPNLEPGVNYRLSVPMDAGTGPFSSRTCPPSINRR